MRRKSSERTARPRPSAGAGDQGPRPAPAVLSPSAPQPAAASLLALAASRGRSLCPQPAPPTWSFSLPLLCRWESNIPPQHTPPSLPPALPTPTQGQAHGSHVLVLVPAPCALSPAPEDRSPLQTHEDPPHPRRLSGPPWTCWLPRLPVWMARGALPHPPGTEGSSGSHRPRLGAGLALSALGPGKAAHIPISEPTL